MSWNEKGELSEDARYDLLQLHKEAQKLSTEITHRLALTERDVKDDHPNSWWNYYNKEIISAVRKLNFMWESLNE
jgi:hypothetical protein